MPRRLALTGPAAAAHWDLDGFRDRDWPLRWCAPIGTDNDESVVRLRAWQPPTMFGDVAVAPIATVLRHLGHDLEPAARWVGDSSPIAPIDLVELALEHALRDRKITLADLRLAGTKDPAAQLLRQVLQRRPKGEPPTESYAETRAVQVFRDLEIAIPWRQVPILDNGRQLYRADFAIPYRRERRPAILRPEHAMLVEIDTKGFHARSAEDFERDARRDATYAALGFNLLVLTATQIERERLQVAKSLAGALGREIRAPRRHRPRTSKNKAA